MAHFYTPLGVPCDVRFFAAPEPPTREVDSLKAKTKGETIIARTFSVSLLVSLADSSLYTMEPLILLHRDSRKILPAWYSQVGFTVL